MQSQTHQTQGTWLELKGSAIDIEREGLPPLRFVLLQNGPVRGGAWLVGGQPFVFIPAGQA